VFAEFSEERFVEEVEDVFGVVKRGRSGRTLVGLLLVGRFARVDA
jgi:hypothetical protein